MNARLDRLLITRLAGLAVVIALLVATAIVLLPFVAAGLLAAVFVMSTWPIFRRIRRRLRSDSWAAALMTALTLVMVVIPLAAAIEAAVQYVPVAVDVLRGWVERGPPPPPAWLARVPLFGESLVAQWTQTTDDPGALRALGLRALEMARAPLLSGGRILGGGLLQLSLATLLAFFLWRDGDALVARLRRGLQRIAGPLAQEMLDLTHATVRAVMVGFIGTGLAQGVVAAIGFFIAGVPGAALLGVITALLSILPSGTVPVWLGATIWLFVDGQPGWALFMLAWGLLLVSTIDNVVRPMIVSRGASLSFLPVFLGMIGGALAYGFVGLFIGPTLLAVSFRLWQHWAGEPVERRAGADTGADQDGSLRPGEAISREGS